LVSLPKSSRIHSDCGLGLLFRLLGLHLQWTRLPTLPKPRPAPSAEADNEGADEIMPSEDTGDAEWRPLPHLEDMDPFVVQECRVRLACHQDKPREGEPPGTPEEAGNLYDPAWDPLDPGPEEDVDGCD